MMKLKNVISLSFMLLTLLACQKVDSTSSVNSSSASNNKVFQSKDEVNIKGEVNATLKESKEVGQYIDNISVFASSYLYDVNNIINDSGMLGSQSYLHKHTSNEPRKNMFITQANREENFIILTLPNSMSIGRLYIYNFNNFSKIDCSVKEFEVEYSSDGHTFTKFDDKTHILSQYEGKNDEGASFIDDKEYFDFKGLNTKYIKIKFLSNYGGIYYGLSEIRLYQYKDELKENSLIPASLLKEEKKYIPKKNYYMIDGSGMSDVFSLDATSSNNEYFMMESPLKEFTFNLNGNYPIGKIGIWNYNEENNLNKGVKDLKISYSLNGKDYSLLKEVTLNKASGSNNEKVSNIIEIDNVNAQFIKFEFLSNYGGKTYGLSEVRFINGNGRVSEPHMELTGMLSRYSGWTGADGIFTTNLDGNQSIGHTYSVMFNFSDTYVGEVDPISKDRKNYTFRNHTFANLENGNIEFYTDESTIIKAIKDENRSSKDCYYWLGDSLVLGNKYYVFCHYIAKEGVLGFSQKGVDLAMFDIIDNKVDLNSKVVIKDENTNKLSYFSKDGKLDIIFGSAIFENTSEAGVINPDGYIYNYGYMDDRNSKISRPLIVSRVKQENFTNFESYEYLSSEGWVNDITKVKPLIDRVSCEMSVVQINDENSEYYKKYLLTYQKDTIGNEICVALSDTPYGDFINSKVVYAAPDKLFNSGVSFYNAKMHPVLSSKDEYIITYNLNENGNNLNNDDGDIYHPRFIRMKKI